MTCQQTDVHSRERGRDERPDGRMKSSTGAVVVMDGNSCIKLGHPNRPYNLECIKLLPNEEKLLLRVLLLWGKYGKGFGNNFR